MTLMICVFVHYKSTAIYRRPRKMMPSDPIQAMEFAQSKGQAHKEGRTGITLADVAGLDPIVGRLQQV